MNEESWKDIRNDTIITTLIEMTEEFLITAQNLAKSRPHSFIILKSYQILQIIGLYSLISFIRDSLDLINEIEDYAKEKNESTILYKANPIREGSALVLSWVIPYAFDSLRLIREEWPLTIFDALLGVFVYYFTGFIWDVISSSIQKVKVSDEAVWENTSSFPFVHEDNS